MRERERERERKRERERERERDVKMAGQRWGEVFANRVMWMGGLIKKDTAYKLNNMIV